MDYNYSGHPNKTPNSTSDHQESSKNKGDSDMEKSSLEAEEEFTAPKEARVTNPGFERHVYVGARIACSFENRDRIVHAKKKMNPYEPFDSPCDPVPNYVPRGIELLLIHVVLIVLAVAIAVILAFRLRNAENRAIHLQYHL